MNKSNLSRRTLPAMHCVLASATILLITSPNYAQFSVTSSNIVNINGTATPSTNVPMGTYAWTRTGSLAGQYDQVPSGGGQPSVASYATTPVIDPAYAATAMRDVNVPPEFVATAWGTPPLVNHPTAVAAAPNGMVFVGMDGAGSLGAMGHLGRVVRLRDTNNDGVVDEAKPFVPDLDTVRGVVWNHDHLIVLATDVTAHYDRDGDGIAEEKKTLIKGVNWPLTMAVADHATQNIEVGIDGWIYIAVGDIGIFKATGSDGRTIQMRAGGVLRFRYDGSGLELFATGTRNNYGVAVGPLLDAFARDNTNDGGGWNVRLHHFTGMTVHGYPSLFVNFAEEMLAPLADFGGGSGVGAMWLDEPGIPAKWNDAPYTVDWGQRAMFHHALVPKGATYSLPGFEVTANSINGVPLAAGTAGTRAGNEPFIQTTNPLDGDVDGNGNIYLVSWRGGGFNWAGVTHGMVYKVSPKNFTPAPLPDFDRISAAELVQVLAGPSHVRRLEAQRAVLRRKAELGTQVAPLLEALASDRTKPLNNRVVALFTDKQLRGAASTPSIARLVADPTIAAWAIRALGDDLNQARSIPIHVVKGALTSNDPRTRKEALVTLARADSLASAPAMTPLLADSDPVVSHTALQALRSLRAVDAALAIVDSTSASPALRKGALMVLHSIHEQRVTEALAQRLGREPDAGRRADLVGALARLANTEAQWNGTWWATRPSTVGPYYAPAPWAETANVMTAMNSVLDKAGPEETLAIARQYIKQGVSAGAAANKFLAYADTEPALLPQVTSYFATVDEIPTNAVPFLTKVATTRTYAANVRAEAIVALTKTSDRGNWIVILPAVATIGQGGGFGGGGGGRGGPGGGGFGGGRGGAPDPALIPGATVIQQLLASSIEATTATQLQAVVNERNAFVKEAFATNADRNALANRINTAAQAELALALARADALAKIQSSVAKLAPAQVAALAAQSMSAAPDAAFGGRGGGGFAGRGGGGAGGPGGGRGGGAVTPAEQARLAVLNSPRLDDVYPVLIDEAAKLNGDSSQLADAALLMISGRKFGATAPRDAATRALDAGWSDPRRRVQIVMAAVTTRDTSRARQIVAAANDADAAVARAAQYAMQQLGIDPAQLAAAAAAPKLGDMPVAAVLDAVVTARGTSVRGEQLSRELGCIACHTVSASEAPKGPPLYLVSKILPRRELAESILVPSKTIAQGFVSTRIVRRSGETVDGFVVQEATDAVNLRDITSQLTRIPSSDIASRTRLETSLMPEGLVSNLTIAEFASLLDYIESLARQVP